ncbi:MAG TPA: hypothetical protein VJM11_05265 [Nevskiaceae bacterium]|nr:hypothetical protein [Nevskiaceae bacterium]
MIVAAQQARSATARRFGAAVLSQAILSATNLCVGLMLIRHATDAQYGAYVLVFNAILLAVSLQNAFFGPAMVARMTPLDREARGEIVGGLYREQRRMLRPASIAMAALLVVLWLCDGIDTPAMLLGLAAVAALTCALTREYFRIALLSNRLSEQVVRGDLLYAGLLLVGVMVAIAAPEPATAAVTAIALAAVGASLLLMRALHAHAACDPNGAPGILSQIAPLAAWSTAGAAIHWTFGQGYSYVAAAVLDVGAVAALAATRLMLMPVMLLSTGIASIMLPTAASWIQEHGSRVAMRRLLSAATMIALAALGYFALMWLSRDWIFGTILEKHFAHRDELLLLWGAICLLSAMRDQLIYLLIARQRFRRLTALTACCATVSLTISYVAMIHLGVPGALLGVLAGEVLNIVGVALMSRREVATTAPREKASEPGDTDRLPF